MSLNEKIDICQTACMFAGVNVIESLDEDSAEARLLAKSYEKVVESELSLYRWRFATKLHDLGSPLAAAPEYTRFNTAHQMPPDVMSVDTVLDPEYPVDYERVGDQIHTNDSANDTLILKYRFRADESVWNPYFRLLIIYRQGGYRAIDARGSRPSLAASEDRRQPRPDESKAQCLAPEKHSSWWPGRAILA